MQQLRAREGETVSLSDIDGGGGGTLKADMSVMSLPRLLPNFTSPHMRQPKNYSAPLTIEKDTSLYI